MWISATKWQGDRPLPLHIFQKAQATLRLLAPLFFSDGFLQNSLSNDREFCRNLLNKGGSFFIEPTLLSKFAQKREIIFIPVGKWHSPRAPPLSDICSSQMPETEENMYKRYFRMRDPKCRPEQVEWIEMTASEFYRFVNSPEGQGRYFIDMGDVVLEASEAEARSFKAEKNHSCYIQAQEEGWALQMALHQLDKKSRLLIQALYLADERKTERDLAKKFGISQNAINKQKKEILQKLKFLVVKSEKSQQ